MRDFDFEVMDFKPLLNIPRNDPSILPNMWTDGRFDYKNEKWIDASNKSIPEAVWENSTWLRKAYGRQFSTGHTSYGSYHMVYISYKL